MTAPVLDQSARPVPGDEAGRLAALQAYGVLDQPRPAADPLLDAAARLAAYVCGTPTAVVNLIAADRQWQAAAYGTEPGEVAREDAMCSHVVATGELVHVADAREDARFAGGPFVTGTRAAVGLYASAPLLTPDGHAIGTVCAYGEQPCELATEQLDLLRDVADQVMALFEMRRMAAALGRIAGRDPLTGLANRRTAEQVVAAAIARAERGLGTPSVVVVDLDGFAGVNDRVGTAGGDDVLRAAAARLTATARTVDTVARLGGDEFLVLLESTGGPGAVAALGRLRRALAEDWSEVTGGLPVGASLGIATYRPGDGVASLVARADAEMYGDKARRAAAH